jgi:hypothetical protein
MKKDIAVQMAIDLITDSAVEVEKAAQETSEEKAEDAE